MQGSNTDTNFKLRDFFFGICKISLPEIYVFLTFTETTLGRIRLLPQGFLLLFLGN